jgi:hypothetical protein
MSAQERKKKSLRKERFERRGGESLEKLGGCLELIFEIEAERLGGVLPFCLQHRR